MGNAYYLDLIRTKSAMHRIAKLKGLHVWIGNGEKKKGKREGINYGLIQHGQQTEEEEEREKRVENLGILSRTELPSH